MRIAYPRGCTFILTRGRLLASDISEAILTAGAVVAGASLVVPHERQDKPGQKARARPRDPLGPRAPDPIL